MPPGGSSRRLAALPPALRLTRSGPVSAQLLMRTYQQQLAQLQARPPVESAPDLSDLAYRPLRSPRAPRRLSRQAALLRDLAALGEASQRQMQHELDAFMREGLPAIQSILAGGALPAAAAALPAAPPAAAAAAPPAPAVVVPASAEQPGGADDGGYVDLGTLLQQRAGADPSVVEAS